MKTITLLPVKNEAWILPYTLKNFSDFSDYIIVADQNSTDNTREICNKFPKVKLVENPFTGHSNQIRWLLLDEARKIEGNNLIICLDADEMITPDFVTRIKNIEEKKIAIGFSSQWIQLWGNFNSYRTDGVWKNNKKQFAFIDDRKVDYIRSEVINDHTNRIPEIKSVINIESPIIHLQYLAQKRCEVKQAWYMCQELISGHTPKRINLKYSVAKFLPNIKTDRINNSWINGISLPSMDTFQTYNKHQLQEILEMFSNYTSLFFESLDIWHISELKNYFIEKNKRKPKPKTFSRFLIILNILKNKVKNAFK